MLLKSVTVSGVDHVFACSEGEHDETLTIHVLQPGQNLSYSETLQKYDYQQRLKTLNARVKFPEASVRLILVNEDPLIAEEQPEHPFMIWKMKYFMGSSVASLKWEWHMIPTDGVHFYNQICMHSMSTASGLRDQVSLLLGILKAKDKELKQYRIEGCQLRRATAVTQPFDLKSFMIEHKKVLDCAAAFEKAHGIFADDEPTGSLSVLSPSGQNAKPKTLSSGYSASSETSSPRVTPRIRKRKALKISTNHMVRKVMQRRSNPQIEYRSSQSSQETLVDDYFTEIVPIVKKRAVDNDEEPSTSSGLLRGGSANVTEVNATIGNGLTNSDLAFLEEYASSFPAEGANYEEETMEAESIQELYDYTIIQAPIQKPEIHEYPVASEEESTVRNRSELDEIRTLLIHSTDLIQKLIHKNSDESDRNN